MMCPPAREEWMGVTEEMGEPQHTLPQDIPVFVRAYSYFPEVISFLGHLHPSPWGILHDAYGQLF